MLDDMKVNSNSDDDDDNDDNDDDNDQGPAHQKHKTNSKSSINKKKKSKSKKKKNKQFKLITNGLVLHGKLINSVNLCLSRTVTFCAEESELGMESQP